MKKRIEKEKILVEGGAVGSIPGLEKEEELRTTKLILVWEGSGRGNDKQQRPSERMIRRGDCGDQKVN
uniref:Uncharacterized protein n=1 Tax=Ditylenchus dipsaci TaxID=166011 RepID=A0A915DIM0_9BILA